MFENLVIAIFLIRISKCVKMYQTLKANVIMIH